MRTFSISDLVVGAFLLCVSSINAETDQANDGKFFLKDYEGTRIRRVAEDFRRYDNNEEVDDLQRPFGQTHEDVDVFNENYNGPKNEESSWFGQYPEAPRKPKKNSKKKKKQPKEAYGGQTYEDLEIGQNAQKHQDLNFDEHHNQGQEYEEIQFGQKPQRHHDDGQKHEEINPGGQQDKNTDLGWIPGDHKEEKHEDFDFGSDNEEGQKYDDIEIGQKPAKPSGQQHDKLVDKPGPDGQEFENIEIGQKPAKIDHEGQNHEIYDFDLPSQHNQGQKYEDIEFGQKPIEPENGQKYEDTPGQASEDETLGQKSTNDGQKYEEIEFGGKKPDDLTAGQVYEDIDFGSKQNGPDSLDQNKGNSNNTFETDSGKDSSDIVIFPDDNDPGKTDEELWPQDADPSFHHEIYGYQGGCTARPQIPANSILKCYSHSKCRAACLRGYLFPNGESEISIKCISSEWKFQWRLSSEVLESSPSCTPLCLPPCQNNGICVAPDQCHCPKNYGGPQCQYEKTPCLNPPPLPANSMRSCTTRSCTITCANGYAFPDGSGITNALCRDGQWIASRFEGNVIPDCEPLCHPPCTNGGKCLAFNVCQCPQQHTGPQCQYEMSACNGKKLNFNGKYNCSGDGQSLSCQISCPEGIPMSSVPANMYTCLYSTGQFLPQPIPQCVYGDNVLVISNASSSTYHIPGQVISNSWTFGHGQVHIPDEITGLFKEVKPGPGECSTWQGCHYKTFDGKLYSFASNCSFTLVQDHVGNTFKIVLEKRICNYGSACRRNIRLFYQDKEYLLKSEDNAPVLEVNGKSNSVPLFLPGLSVELKSSFIQTSLQAFDVDLRWDGKDYISVLIKENLWNRTSGLCGNLNYIPADDFYTSSGLPAQNLQTFVDSWKTSNSDEEYDCDSPPKIDGPCPSNFSSDHCKLILNNPHFADCRKVINANSFYDACIWDACQCGKNCSCSSIEAFVEECKKHNSAPSSNWRTIADCPMECDGGKVYSSCGPRIQNTCGSFETHTEFSAKIDCNEGCFCPENTVLYDGNCISKELCPCQWKKKIFPSGAQIPKGCNTCTCQNGLWVCTEVNCGSRCSSVGDPHYVTFDGKRFDFMGQCSYYLLKSDNYSIKAENIPCSGTVSKSMSLFDSFSSEFPSCTKTITIRHYDDVIKLKQNREFFVNGQEISTLPHRVNDLSIRSISSTFMIVTLPDEIEVWWDGVTSVYIDVPGEFQGKTKGLCGTFNDNQQDDFLTPEGDIEQSAVAFGNKWKTDEGCIEVPNESKPHPCDSNLRQKALADKYCGQLKSKIFESCHWVVDVEPFYRNCLYDVCSCTVKTKNCFCPIISDYGNECSRAGAPVNWRNEVRECGLHCPGGQIYQPCGDSCSRSCQDISFGGGECRKKCVEGCNCPDGQTLNDHGECIPVSHCSCYHYNIEYKPGHQMVMDNYKGPQFCSCINARWTCRPANKEEIDHDHEINQIRNKCLASKNEEFTFCEPAEPVTCKNMHKPQQHSPRECVPGCICKKGFVWDSIGKTCVKAAECPCHHGGRSYQDGEIMQEDCNTCTCHGGNWNCTSRICPAMCSTWGDSHFKTFDGKIFDFQGSCEFVLSSGSLSDEEMFDLTLQIAPCGSSGISCPRSVTMKVGSRQKYEEISLKKSRPLPHTNDLKKIQIREAGIFVFVEVFDFGIVLQWDRGTRFYVKVDPKWKNKLKGLCGNFNNNELDDFKTPSSGEISEVSAVVFADSWRLQPHCPESVEIMDTCALHPNRKTWALKECSLLKSTVFEPCHSEVPVEPYIERCVTDSCGCDEGGDCECLCTSVSAYAHECTLRGVPLKWRTKDFCPLQCDAKTSYSSCVSPCPTKTCDNHLQHSSLIKICSQESCVEGCEVTSCPSDEIYTDMTLSKCSPISSCKTVCLTVGNITYLEGDLMESDECYSCFCSRHKKACLGKPCPTTLPIPVTTLPTITEVSDEKLLCISGWSSWINRKNPIKHKVLDDIEELPTFSELNAMNSLAQCSQEKITNIRCRDSLSHVNFKETGYDVECSTERGLVCVSSNETCPDFEISVHCQCKDIQEVKTTSTERITTESSVCPVGKVWDECIVRCDKICHYYRPVLHSQNYCNHQEICVQGCKNRDFECPFGTYLRDESTCVPKNDCPCRSLDGKIVKPGEVIQISECEKCQCVNNEYECLSTCGLPPPTPKTTPGTTVIDKDNRTHTLPGKGVIDNGNVNLIYITTTTIISPLPYCPPTRFTSLLKDPGVKVSASSSLDESTTLQSGVIPRNDGFWTAGRENSDQFLQIDLGQIEPIYGVVVAPNPAGRYVKSYHLLHSTDGHKYFYVTSLENANELFGGPLDQFTPVRQALPKPVEARFVRFHPFSWHEAISMRVDVLGCSEFEMTTPVPEPMPCSDAIGLSTGNLPVAHLSESSSKPGHDVSLISLDSEGGWQPLTNSKSEWVVVDLALMRNITGLMTKGISESNDLQSTVKESWVERYQIFYSRDGISWNPIVDEFNLEKVFVGNSNGDEVVKNYFKRPIHARFLKFVPVTWHNNIGLRLEVLGCFEPYTIAITTTSTPSRSLDNCNVCKGVSSQKTGAECECEEGKWWDGDSCVNDVDCPCFFGHISYPVGTTFKTEDCQDCVCRVFGVASCSPTQCGDCGAGLQKTLTPSCLCTCKPCPENYHLCITSNVCIEETAWCDGIQDCPDDENDCTVPITEPPCVTKCPPGFKVIYKSLPGPAEVDIDVAKGVKRPKKVKTPVILRCPAYECSPVATESTGTECPIPSCPLNYKVISKGSDQHAACPRFTCEPPPEMAICHINSNYMFSTFDGTHYKYEICDHVLARDDLEKSWSVSSRQQCMNGGPCSFVVLVHHQDHEITFHPQNGVVKVDGFEYTYDQVELVGSKLDDFNLQRIGNSVVFKSNLFKFSIVFDQNEILRIKVPHDLKGHVNGLCGLFNGYSNDDKTKPDGTLAKSTAEFGKSWLRPGAAECEISVCPLETQKKALEICASVRKEPFDVCSDELNLHLFEARCMESICACLSSNKSIEDCRCSILQELSTECKRKELVGWRIKHGCPSHCPPDMVHHDCYPNDCESTCNKICTKPASTCYSGCFCPDGTVRKNDKCVQLSECRDCTCRGFGSSSYLSFDGRNFTFNGNCTYVAARDIPESGVPNFQILVTNGPCSHDIQTVCTKQINIHVKGHSIIMRSENSDDEKGSIAITVDGEGINTNENLVKEWVVVEDVFGTSSVNLLLPSYFVNLRYFYKRQAFSIDVPSYYYRNNTEGLCGSCSTKVSKDEKPLDVEWVVHSASSSCKPVTPEECSKPAEKDDKCRYLLQQDIFGQCHKLIDVQPFLDECYALLCHNGSFCNSFEAYAQACRDIGVCASWRSADICPLKCATGTEYHACEVGCTKNCDNYLHINETCTKPFVEGCFCPLDKILVNGSCESTSICEICDAEGHHNGDEWRPDICTNCTCSDGKVNCISRECFSVDITCEEDHVPFEEKNIHECCSTVKCVCKPREECKPILQPEDLAPGMRFHVNNSGCCPREEILCAPETCPKPEPCADHLVMKKINTTSCCPDYVCEKPDDICLHGTYDNPHRFAKKVGKHWKEGPCKVCHCLENSESKAETVCKVLACEAVENLIDYKDYVLRNITSAEKCCPDYQRVECRHDGKTYKVGDSWTPDPSDACKTVTCVENEDGIIEKLFNKEICYSYCDIGWKYVKDEGSCCGRCEQMGCVVDGVFHGKDDVWYSDDNCTTFSCTFVLGGYLVTSSYETCPSLSYCPPENVYKDKCCSRCNATLIEPKSACTPVALPSKKTVHLIREIQSRHGRCSNMDPIPNFTECEGACDSHTVYRPETWSHENICRCCQPVEFSSIAVPLTCEDGFVIQKYVTVPSKCSCQSCG